MQKSMLRKSNTVRVIESVGVDLYSPARITQSSVQGVEARLLKLGDPVHFNTWERLTGWALPPHKRVARILLLHRLAFDAELRGQLRRADFFWREVHARLRRIWPRADVWEAARIALGDGAPTDAHALRNLVTTELLLDTHIAFANGRFSASDELSVEDRAFVHVGFIRDLLQLHRLPDDECTTLLTPAVEAEMDALERAKRWDEAIALGKAFFAQIVDQPQAQERLALLYFHRCINRLADKPEGNELADAHRLEEAIEQITGLCRANANVLLYDLIGQLHHLHSIRLANAGELADALVASRKAQVFAPSLEAADQVMSQLRDNMTKLQGQMKEIEAQLRQSSNVSLSAEGQWLRAQTHDGYRKLEQYMKSGGPERIAASRRLAHAHRLWRDVHADPMKACTDERALELFDAVAALYGSEAQTAEELAAAFEENAVSSQFLAGLPASQIAAFILKRRRENSGEAQESAAQPQADATVAPCIVVPARVSRRDLEPFRYWLFGTQDRATRALAAVVALVAVGVLAVSLVEIPNRWVRDTAVAEMGDALQRGDHEAAIAAAEHFLGASRPQIADPRREAILDVYAREFSNWFSSLAETLSDTDRTHIERYRKLASANQSNGVKP